MKRIETVAQRQMQVSEVDSPSPRDDEILLKTLATSVLMENVGLYNGEDPRLKAPGNPLYRGYPDRPGGRGHR